MRYSVQWHDAHYIQKEKELRGKKEDVVRLLKEINSEERNLEEYRKKIARAKTAGHTTLDMGTI